jgi:hypothetical protein
MFKKTAGKVFEFLVPKPKVNKTTLDEAKSKLAKTIQKGKATSAKLKQTQFEINNPQFKGKDFTFATTNKKTESNTEKAQKAFKKEDKKETKTRHFYAPKNFNKGGRVGLKRGTNLMPKKKSNIQKIQETFGPGKNNPKKSAAKKKKFPDLTGDGKVTFADILKGRGVKRG